MSSLPNNDDEEEESVPNNTFVLRITPPENHPDPFVFLKTKFDMGVGSVLISEEISDTGVLHFHIVGTFEGDFEEHKDWIRRQVIYALYPAPRPRGFGIKQWHCQPADNPNNAVAYALKAAKLTQRFWYDGYTAEYIEQMSELSFTKSTRSAFSTDFTELKKKFQESKMTVEQFMVEFIQLKGKHEQMVNLTHAYQYGLSCQVKRDPSSAGSLVRSFLNKNSY